MKPLSLLFKKPFLFLSLGLALGPTSSWSAGSAEEHDTLSSAARPVGAPRRSASVPLMGVAKNVTDFSDPTTYRLESFNTLNRVHAFLGACDFSVQSAPNPEAREEELRQMFNKIEVVSTLLKRAALVKALRRPSSPRPSHASASSPLPEWPEDGLDSHPFSKWPRCSAASATAEESAHPLMGPFGIWSSFALQERKPSAVSTSSSLTVPSEEGAGSTRSSFAGDERDEASEWVTAQMNRWMLWSMTGKRPPKADSTSRARSSAASVLSSASSRGSYDSDGVPALTPQQAANTQRAVMEDIRQTLRKLVLELSASEI